MTDRDWFLRREPEKNGYRFEVLSSTKIFVHVPVKNRVTYTVRCTGLQELC